MAASKTIKVEISGIREALSTLRQLDEQAFFGAKVLLKDFVDTQVIAPAKEIVPVDTGNLKATLRTEGPVVDGTRITVSAVAGGSAAKYALAVHENPRSGETGGLSPSGKKYKHWARVGEWKYLERPAMEAASSAGTWLTEAAAILVRQMKGAE